MYMYIYIYIYKEIERENYKQTGPSLYWNVRAHTRDNDEKTSHQTNKYHYGSSMYFHRTPREI